MTAVLQKFKTLGDFTREIAIDRAARILLLRASAVRLRGLAGASQICFREQLLCLAQDIDRHVRVLETTGTARTIADNSTARR